MFTGLRPHSLVPPFLPSELLHFYIGFRSSKRIENAGYIFISAVHSIKRIE